MATRLLDDGLPEGVSLHGRVAAVLEHERVPFISYPYEWPFGMLRDAALLQLELVERALSEDLMLKDSSPYNVQWRGTHPVFVDIGSFERLREGEPWAGYRQFCMLFLFPLLLQAYKGVPFQPWLRGRVGGITPEECRAVMSVRDLLRRGVLTHVFLHSALERRKGGDGGRVRRDLRAAGFRKDLILANVRRLRRLVERLDAPAPSSLWRDYGAAGSYSDEDAGRKAEFVRAAAASRRWNLVWDIGCNVGHYARIAAEHARYVVAVDADAPVVEDLYRSLRAEEHGNVLPLVVDVADPSPGLGWRGRERRPLEERGKPDLTLCLALVHHVSISANVPVVEFLDWLRGLGSSIVVEFPTREDPMVESLLARKREGASPDYERPWFERCLEERFRIDEAVELPGGTRVLYRGEPR